MDFPANLSEELTAEAKREFPGLTNQRVNIFGVIPGGTSGAVWWTVRGTHGVAPSTTWPDPAAAASADEFLGFHATGRKVVIDVVSFLVDAPLPANQADSRDDHDHIRRQFAGWRHGWDRLGALQQIGVSAVGRPVLR
jgi:hypothetical protein